MSYRYQRNQRSRSRSKSNERRHSRGGNDYHPRQTYRTKDNDNHSKNNTQIKVDWQPRRRQVSRRYAKSSSSSSSESSSSSSSNSGRRSRNKRKHHEEKDRGSKKRSQDRGSRKRSEDRGSRKRNEYHASRKRSESKDSYRRNYNDKYNRQQSRRAQNREQSRRVDRSKEDRSRQREKSRKYPDDRNQNNRQLNDRQYRKDRNQPSDYKPYHDKKQFKNSQNLSEKFSKNERFEIEENSDIYKKYEKFEKNIVSPHQHQRQDRYYNNAQNAQDNKGFQQGKVSDQGNKFMRPIDQKFKQKSPLRIQIVKQSERVVERLSVEKEKQKNKFNEHPLKLTVSVTINDKKDKKLSGEIENKFEPAFPIKRSQKLESTWAPAKQKVPDVIDVINEAKKNLQIPPLEMNFMILDSYRTMNKLKAETLDPTLLSWLKRSYPSDYKAQKQKVFEREVQLTEDRQKVWMTIPQTPDDTQIALKSELESYRANMLALDELLRQMIILE